MRRLATLLFGLLAASPLVLFASCREPTQITVGITTDLPCVGLADDAGALPAAVPGLFSREGRVALWISGDSPSKAPQTVARSCTQGASTAQVGTIAIVPSKSNDDRVTVTAAINVRDPARSEECSDDPPSPDCIVARRTVGFIPHTPLTLPIHLALACTGVVCKKGQTCENGVCVSDVVTCTDKSCLGPEDAAVDGRLDAALVDAGACDGGGLGNAQNCGKCGLPCNGICLGDACQIPKVNSGIGDEGCIAVDGVNVYWSVATLGVGGVYWAPRAGANMTTIEDKLPVGVVAASSSSASYVVRDRVDAGASFVRDLTGAPPSPTGNAMPAIAFPGTHDWLARSPTARCAATSDGISVAGVDCDLVSWKGPGAPRIEHLAVGKSSYLAVRATGDLLGGAVASTLPFIGTAPKSPFVVGAIGQTDDYVVASQSGTEFLLTRVTVDLTGNKIAAPFGPFLKHNIAILGVKVAGTSVYFADALNRIFKVDLGGTASQAPVLVVPTPLAGLTKMKKTRTCLDVDDVAVYYLVNGIPRRSPR